uniref:Uncharacterized protein n=1 Tax=Arundo donax TaxID=35708 RepID=A0A0A9G2Q3_ARUDO
MTAAASLDGEPIFSVALNNAMKTTPPELTVTSKLLLLSSSVGSVQVVECFVWCTEVRELQLKLIDSISIIETLASLSQRFASGSWSKGSE